MKAKYVLICAIGALILGVIIGAIVVAISLATPGPNGATVITQNNFNVFVGVLLACIALIITVFGIILAILSVFGFSTIIVRVEQTVEDQVDDLFQPGNKMYEMTKDLAEAAMYDNAGIEPVKLSEEDDN